MTREQKKATHGEQNTVGDLGKLLQELTESAKEGGKIFESENKFDNLFYGFVHQGITYCFFIISNKPLPTKLLAYKEAIKDKRIFALAIERHTKTYGKLESAKALTRDYQCMQHANGSFQVVKVCEQLVHVFIN